MLKCEDKKTVHKEETADGLPSNVPEVAPIASKPPSELEAKKDTWTEKFSEALDAVMWPI